MVCAANPSLMPGGVEDFFVRLNMGSKKYMYVPAQVVEMQSPEGASGEHQMQVRGADRDRPSSLTLTQLCYVSNKPFTEEARLPEITRDYPRSNKPFTAEARCGGGSGGPAPALLPR